MPFQFPAPEPSAFEKFMMGWQAGQQMRAQREEEERAQRLEMQKQQAAQEALAMAREQRQILKEQHQHAARGYGLQEKLDEFKAKSEQFNSLAGKRGPDQDIGAFNLNPDNAGQPLKPSVSPAESMAAGNTPGKYEGQHAPIQFPSLDEGGTGEMLRPPNETESLLKAVAAVVQKNQLEAQGAAQKKEAEKRAEEPFAITEDQRTLDRQHDQQKATHAEGAANRAVTISEGALNRQSREELASMRAEVAGAKAEAAASKVTGLSGETATKFAVSKSLIKNLTDIQNELQKDYQATVAGILSGTDARLSKKFKMIVGQQVLMKSGTAASDKERADIRSQLLDGWDVLRSVDPKKGVFIIPEMIQEAQTMLDAIDPTGKFANAGTGMSQGQGKTQKPAEPTCPPGSHPGGGQCWAVKGGKMVVVSAGGG